MARFILRSHLRPWGRRWTFTLVAGNGEPVLASEVYSSKSAALTGIVVVRRLAAAASVIDETGDGEPMELPEGPDDMEPFPGIPGFEGP